ncbi:MAG: hypothetical protein H0T78_07550 [Longispora sp.]|nr:hypothetical protein [Longispora sp. (in: high G+C Gram-positive bacteria)]
MRRKLAVITLVALTGIGVAGCFGDKNDSAITSGTGVSSSKVSNSQLCDAIRTETKKMSDQMATSLADAAASADDATGGSETLTALSQLGRESYTKLAGMASSNPKLQSAFTKLAEIYDSLRNEDLSTTMGSMQEIESISKDLASEMGRVCTAT